MGRILTTSLQKRAVSAAVLIPLTLGVIYYGGALFAAVLVLLAALSLYEWLYVSLKTTKPFVFSAVGVLYVLVSFWCCFLIREGYPLSFAFMFLLMIWASDIGAYVTGKTFKGPKMASKISPNKTWSGYAGALLSPAILSVLALSIYAMIKGDASLVGLRHGAYLFATGAVIGLVGQSGDLIVSFLKRNANVKDTGRLIPGHGGLLDRIDSMLLAAPVYLFIISEFSHVAGR